MTAIQVKEKCGSMRESGIELLKIAAIFLIVISHVVQTLSSGNSYVSYSDYVLDISNTTTNLKLLTLAMLRCLGAMGNSIFFVCSAWFLLDSNKVSKKKVLMMILDIWLVSVSILAAVFFLRGGAIDRKLMIKSLFPTFFGNNWYLTCYILFYPLHPILNKIIHSMGQKAHLAASTVMSFLYILCNFVWGGVFFSSALMLWVTIYLIVAYIKLYVNEMAENLNLNIFFALVGVLGNVGLILLTNFLGLRISFLAGHILHWNSNCNPFIILTAIALMNIARHGHFKNKTINSISKLSLLIYIIHENILLRSYYRPYMWRYIYENFGYEHVVLWVFAMAIIIFAAATIVSFLYEKTLQRLVKAASEKIYVFIKALYGKYELLMFKLH